MWQRPQKGCVIKMDTGLTPEVMTAISTVGFPIVACCVLFYLYDKTLREVITALKELCTTMHLIQQTLERDQDREG